MRILHLLSQFEVTGAEAYATTLADRQIQAGHEVWVASDTLTLPTRATYLEQKLGDRSWKARIANIQWLKKWLKDNPIDVVHAHSRAASWVAAHALKAGKVPLVSTVHGRQHLHLSTYWLDIYGDRVIVVCENLKQHLVEEVGIEDSKIEVLPNAVEFPEESTYRSGGVRAGEKQWVSILGRSTGPKGVRVGELAEKVLPAVLKDFPQVGVRIAGGDPAKFLRATLGQIQKLTEEFPGRVEVCGFEPGLWKKIDESRVVIASGRIAVEAISRGVPVVALGESCGHGQVSEENLSQALASNFGDIWPEKNLPSVDWEEIEKSVRAALTEPEESLKGRVQPLFEASWIAQRVEEVYRSARMKRLNPNGVPVLMYHKVLETKPKEAKHRIFVTRQMMRNHLIWLKRWGFTTLTFADYDEFRAGKRSISEFPEKPVILSFDDGYLNNYKNLFPLLQETGSRAVIFTVADEAIRRNEWDVREGEEPEELMSTAQKKEMLKAGVAEFGSHSLSHPRLTELSDEEAWREISGAKEALEGQLGGKILSFAYPYGNWSNRERQLAIRAGYQYAISTDHGGVHLEDDPWGIFRVSMFPEDGWLQLRKKTSGVYRQYYRWKRGK